MFIPNWQEPCIQGRILLVVGKVDICMHDLFSLKHCVLIDIIHAIMVQDALGGSRGEFLYPTAIKQADLFEYLTVKMLPSPPPLSF